MASDKTLKDAHGVSMGPPMKKTVAVDLDGVLARYDGWRGIDHIGEPIPGARAFVRVLREQFEVVIFTTRCNTKLNREGANLLRNRIRDWLDQHGFEYDDIHTDQGKPAAVAYVDDRAVECRPESYENPIDCFTDAILDVQDLADPSEFIKKHKVPTYPMDKILDHVPELMDVRRKLQRAMGQLDQQDGGA